MLVHLAGRGRRIEEAAPAQDVRSVRHVQPQSHRLRSQERPHSGPEIRDSDQHEGRQRLQHRSVPGLHQPRLLPRVLT